MLIQLKNDDGSFKTSFFDESDLRGTYAAVIIIKLLEIKDDILEKNLVEFVLNCQTYEGGFGPRPDLEAHGGFTFCAVAILSLTNSLERCNLRSL